MSILFFPAYSMESGLHELLAFWHKKNFPKNSNWEGRNFYSATGFGY